MHLHEASLCRASLHGCGALRGSRNHGLAPFLLGTMHPAAWREHSPWYKPLEKDSDSQHLQQCTEFTISGMSWKNNLMQVVSINLQKKWSIYNKSIYQIDLKCLLNIFHWKKKMFSILKKVSVRKGLERQDLATYLEAKIMDGNI